jgi:hypothetical protein
MDSLIKFENYTLISVVSQNIFITEISLPTMKKAIP